MHTKQLDTIPAAVHTPGPWTLQTPVNVETHPRMADWRQDVIGPPDPTRANSSLVVATVINADCPEGPANARLIAAAPELLQACKFFMDSLASGALVRDISHNSDPNWHLKMVDFMRELSKAQSAIAKAESPPLRTPPEP